MSHKAESICTNLLLQQETKKGVMVAYPLNFEVSVSSK